jgi:hypothetical protein
MLLSESLATQQTALSTPPTRPDVFVVEENVLEIQIYCLIAMRLGKAETVMVR